LAMILRRQKGPTRSGKSMARMGDEAAGWAALGGSPLLLPAVA
jgi:hypothetical protein